MGVTGMWVTVRAELSAAARGPGSRPLAVQLLPAGCSQLGASTTNVLGSRAGGAMASR